MKTANIAPAYAGLYAGLCEVARENGYALAIHGSLANDMDVVAIPWTDEAVAPEALALTKENERLEVALSASLGGAA